MTSVTLAYSFTTVEDCEDAWNELVDGDVTSTLNSSNYKVGAGSASLAASAAVGNGDILATEARASLDLSALTHLAWWSYNAAAITAGDFQMLIDEDANCASPSETLSFFACGAGEWRRHVVAFAGATSDRNAIISIGCKQNAVIGDSYTLLLDDIQACLAKTYTVYSVHGVDDLDDLAYWPPHSKELLDGSLKEVISGFRRVITIDFGPIMTKADRLFLHNWAKASDKRLITENDDIQVVLADPAGLSNTWLQDVSLFRAFTLRLFEKSIRTTNPTSWSYT